MHGKQNERGEAHLEARRDDAMTEEGEATSRKGPATTDAAGRRRKEESAYSPEAEEEKHEKEMGVGRGGIITHHAK